MSHRTEWGRARWVVLAGVAAACLGLPSAASAATFNATPSTLGFVGDSPGPVGNFGTPLDIQIPVSGFGSGGPSTVAVTISAEHASVGDLRLELIAPGATTGELNKSKVIFIRTGSTSGPGDESTLDGTYVFADAAPASPTWWSKAASTAEGQPILSGFSRASLANGTNTTIATGFTSVSSMNGTWTLRVSDGRGGGIGQITAAKLDLTGSVAATPSSLVGGIPDNGTEKNVTFPISGLNGAPTSVAVSMTFNPTHTFAGDLEAILFAPNNTQATIFSRTGLTSGTPNGDDSDLTGPYLFFDNNANNWWPAAASTGSSTAIPSNSYRPSDSTGAFTPINPTFATVANPNGTWRLRFRDLAGGDSGGVDAAELSIIEGPDNTPPLLQASAGLSPASPSSSNTPRIQGVGTRRHDRAYP